MNAPSNINEARVLILSDGRQGGLNQSLGIATMLGFKDPEVLTLRRAFPQKWLGWLPVGFLYENLRGIESAANAADLLIGAGHGPSRVMRWLKGKKPGLFTVAILRPSGKLTHYDVVTTPKHDGLKPAPNLITTLGNTNLITQEKLAQEGQRWAKRLSHVRGFKVAVLIGGSSKHGQLPSSEAAKLITELAAALKKQFSEGAGLLVTTSRRTGAAATKAVAKALEECGLPYHFWEPNDPSVRDNPYFAFLHTCNAVVVTPDSSSMVSEACTSGRATYLWGNNQGVPKKFIRMYTDLTKQGRLKWWDGQFNLRPPAAPLLDTLLVAGFIRAMWQKRFGPAKG